MQAASNCVHQSKFLLQSRRSYTPFARFLISLCYNTAILSYLSVMMTVAKSETNTVRVTSVVVVDVAIVVDIPKVGSPVNVRRT